MVDVADAGTNGRQPQHLCSPQLGKGFVDLFVRKGDLRVLPCYQRQGGREIDGILVLGRRDNAGFLERRHAGRNGSVRLSAGALSFDAGKQNGQQCKPREQTIAPARGKRHGFPP